MGRRKEGGGMKPQLDTTGIEPKAIQVGPYTLREHGPIPGTDQVHVLWIEHDNGEGMSVDLDKLWRGR